MSSKNRIVTLEEVEDFLLPGVSSETRNEKDGDGGTYKERETCYTLFYLTKVPTKKKE